MKGQEDRMVKRRVDEVEKRIGSFVWFKFPIKLKGFFLFFYFFKNAIQPATLYGTECWAVKKQYIHKIIKWV